MLLRVTVSAVVSFSCLTSAVALALSSSNSPVAKVITLLEDLKLQVEDEGKAEAGVYETFACFCKDSTATKSGSIASTQDQIDTTSANIQADVATHASKKSDLTEREAQQEANAKELEETTGRCLKESAEFEANVADLTKAVSSLEKAVAAMKSKKPAAAVLLSLQESVGESLKLAEALQFIMEPKRQAVRAFLQQPDPVNPEYSFHSAGIIETLEKLFEEFTTAKADTQAEWGKATQICDDMKKSIRDEMDGNDNAMKTLKEDLDQLKVSIAGGRESLVQAESLLQDDQVYLRDATERCEARAKDWDQRSTLRAGELEALAQALAILKGDVQDADAAVNVRAMLLQKRQRPTSFMQVSGTVAHPKIALISAQRRDVAAHLRDTRASTFLNEESVRLSSPVLSALAARVVADPFSKVKQLIQQLIERLLAESTQEATKKSFCDEEVGKATQSRDFRASDTSKLSAEIEALHAKKDSLALEISQLKEAANVTSTSLDSAATVRSDEKTVNLDTMAKAKEGLKALKDAIAILKQFYKSAAKAKVLLQESPVEANDPGAGFEGAYTGQQEASKGIFGLLEVIKSDFERTIETTTSEEKRAAADFVDFDRTSRASIAGKEKGCELNEQELKSTHAAINQKTEDLTTAQELLDKALQAIEDLKPMCIDNVMTFAERTAKRDEEIAALKTALCYLDPDQVEDECK
jgi:hypothetical protein